MKKTEFSQYEEEVIRLRRHFHQYPELALQEFQTSAFIQKYLEELGYQVRHVPPTGLIAEHPCMKNREKMVVLRAEMDALPVQECTGLDYASRNEGCMHACGHDGILAVALILAKILSGKRIFLWLSASCLSRQKRLERVRYGCWMGELLTRIRAGKLTDF